MPFSMLIPSTTAPDLIAIVVTAIDVVAVIVAVVIVDLYCKVVVSMTVEVFSSVVSKIDHGKVFL